MFKRKLAFSMFLLTSNFIFANENIILDEVVVTASGYEQDIKNAPATINIITQEDLKSKNIQDLGQALKNIAGIDVSFNNQGTSNFSIRGFGKDYLLVLVDGKRKNSIAGFFDHDISPSDGFAIPPIEAIERIEVIKGASSTLYGSDAVGGVINIITKKNTNKFYASLKLNTLINQHSEYANSGGFETFLNIPITDNFSSSFRAKYYKKGASKLVYPNGILASNQGDKLQNYNIGTRLNYNFLDNHNIYFDYERINSEIFYISDKSEERDKKVIQDNFALDYKGEIDTTSINSFAQTNLIKDKSANSKGKTIVIDNKLIHPFDFDKFGIATLSAGINYQYEDYKGESENESKMLNDKKLSQKTYSPYLELEYFLPENLTITQGLRYTKSNLFDKEISPRIYASYNLNDNFTIKGGVSKGYKLPKIKEIYNGLLGTVRSGGRNIYGNPNLKPENSINYELGFYVDYLDNNFSVVGFITKLKNEIAQERFSDGDLMPNGLICEKPASARNNHKVCRIPINKDKNTTKGIELSFKSASFNGFSINSSYTFMNKTYDDKENRFGTNRVEGLPKHIINATLNYKKDKFSSFFQANARLNTLKDFSEAPINKPKYKDFYTFDLGFNYDFTKNSSLSFVVYNIFDKNYFSPYEYETGQRTKTMVWGNEYEDYTNRRSFYLSFKYDF